MTNSQKKVKNKILIADDSEMNRSILADILGDEFEILEASNGTEAISILQSYGETVSLLLLDMVMPEMDGFEVLAIMNRVSQNVPVIIICQEENISQYIERAYALGAADYISPPFDSLVVYRRATNIIKLYAKRDVTSAMAENEDKFAKAARYEEWPASERTLELLEQERIKYSFFASMSKEVQFEYKNNPPVIRISEFGQEKFNIKELIVDPQNDKSLMAIIGEKNYQHLVAALRAATPYNPIVQSDCEINVNGEERWVRVICRALWPNENSSHYTGVIGKLTDIHEEHMRMISLQHAASHDPLTGICNHAHAKEKILSYLHNYPEKKYALALFDIDHFKQVNDVYGHMSGDHVLQYVAKKLRENASIGDVFARIGGDEFEIFLEYDDNPNAQIDKIFSSLSGVCEDVSFTVSMGVSDTELLGRNYDVLFRCADQALYACKRSGRGAYRFYDVTMKESAYFKETIGTVRKN